ncbi:2-oxoglutarate and iron-dependent oxygenase domain-containing protein [Mesorhizobium sp. M0244]|uniref:2-oxoglutarate and iron-dependent oxygenase domain-containing protein n=1 Tax=Mesorhizobium sp. M0244 TaxID=2956926 RepID=UPI003339CC59
MTTLPQISLAKLATDATRHDERERLRLACEEHGFFYLEHGIPKEQIAEAIQASRRFFALPQSTKERYGHSAQDVYPATARGYSPLLGEVLHPDAGPDPKEMFDLGIENEDDRRPFAGRTRLPDDTLAPGFAQSLLALQATVGQRGCAAARDRARRPARYGRGLVPTPFQPADGPATLGGAFTSQAAEFSVLRITVSTASSRMSSP